MTRRRTRPTPTHPTPGRAAAAPGADGSSVGGVWFWGGLGLAAFVLRVLLVLFTPGTIYLNDHDDFARWGIQATDAGPLTLYDQPPQRHSLRVFAAEGPVVVQRDRSRLCNYPPLSVSLLYGSGLLFRAVSTDRLINTTASRLAFCGWSMLGDVLLAAGCATVVSLLRPGRAARWTYALLLIAPPFWWDSVMWGQMDSVFLAPAVWMLYAMLRQRWTLAGLLWGVALGLKPQGVLFLPAWILAAAMVRPMRRTLAGPVAAVVVLLVSAMPFLLHSGWAWFRLSYLENLFSTYSDFTTLKAFNIWYLDILITDSPSAGDTWLGWTKLRWGQAFLALTLLAGFLLILRRWQSDIRGLIPWTGLSLLAFVMLPTQVHERYLVLALPFLAIAVVLTRRLWPALLVLLIVAMVQMSWPLWLQSAPGRSSKLPDEVRQQFTELQGQAAAARSPSTPLAESPPSFEETLRWYESQYRQTRQATVRLEWICTVLALLAAAGAITVLATLSPHGLASHRAEATRVCECRFQ